jgi:Protein of unknown function (DUF5132)
VGAENAKAVLSKKSINAIADQVELRVRQGSTKPVTADKDVRDGKKLFFWGAASGLALAVTAPLLGRQARPVVRGAIKGGLVAGRYFRQVASSVKEDIEDITAEAEADLDIEKPESAPGKRSKSSKKASE